MLIDSSGMAVLSDTQYNSIVNIDPAALYSFIDSRSRWTSPEALIGDPVSDTCARASKEADIYAAAMTIAQASDSPYSQSSFLADHDLPSVKFWTLQLPFAHIRSPIAVTAMLMKLTNDEIASADLRDKLPYIIWTALKDCLRVRPSMRPDANELLSRFQRILEDELRAMVSVLVGRNRQTDKVPDSSFDRTDHEAFSLYPTRKIDPRRASPGPASLSTLYPHSHYIPGPLDVLEIMNFLGNDDPLWQPAQING